ncbi:MAG: (d)CMP kinase [Chloroflexi bacterium]|nr:(d)CMP kinase [Chloroflexota bacterium]
MTPSIIAIDGPAASGKSTIGALLAEKLGYLFFDTGIMYRAVTAVALARGTPISDEKAITRLAEEIQIDVLPPDAQDGRQFTVRADDRDITWEIRERAVDVNVSPVSAYIGVRHAMSAQQRRVGWNGKVVMVGRDIGTVVLPEADIKIYLDATEDERARRRYRERLQRGEPADYATVLKEIQRRDEIDSKRSFAPLKKADDAIYVDSTHMSIPEVLARVMRIIEQKPRNC